MPPRHGRRGRDHGRSGERRDEVHACAQSLMPTGSHGPCSGSPRHPRPKGTRWRSRSSAPATWRAASPPAPWPAATPSRCSAPTRRRRRRSPASSPATCAPAPSATRSPATSSCSPSGTRRSTTSWAATATSSPAGRWSTSPTPSIRRPTRRSIVEAGSAAQEIAAKAPGAKVVKAFNTTFAGSLVEGQVAGPAARRLRRRRRRRGEGEGPRDRRERRPARPGRRPARARPPARRRRLPAHGDPAGHRRHLRQRPEDRLLASACRAPRSRQRSGARPRIRSRYADGASPDFRLNAREKYSWSP